MLLLATSCSVTCLHQDVNHMLMTACSKSLNECWNLAVRNVVLSQLREESADSLQVWKKLPSVIVNKIFWRLLTYNCSLVYLATLPQWLNYNMIVNWQGWVRKPMLSEPLVTTAWRVLRLRMEEKVSRLESSWECFSKQSRTADKGWSSSSRAGRGLTTPHSKRKHVKKCYTGPWTWIAGRTLSHGVN
jgi:hypothetical protein